MHCNVLNISTLKIPEKRLHLVYWGDVSTSKPLRTLKKEAAGGKGGIAFFNIAEFVISALNAQGRCMAATHAGKAKKKMRL